MTRFISQQTRTLFQTTPKSPFVTSGIRLGTPAVTTRGANEADMEIIADAIKAAVLDNDKAKAEQLVKSIVEKYPLYA